MVNGERMRKNNYYIDRSDPLSVEVLIDAFDVRDTPDEWAIRAALGLHERSFILYVDHVNRPQISPLDDPFTFNMETDELVLFTDDPDVLVDAILEMALYVRGFNTLMGIDDEWKIQIAIGAWRHVRESLKVELGLAVPPMDKRWSVTLDLETVERYNMISFAAAVYLAGRPDLDVEFPQGTSALVVTAYERLSRIVEALAWNIGLDDQQKFNRRLNRALAWIEESIMPQDISPFDDLFGPEGFSDKFFEDDPDDVL